MKTLVILLLLAATITHGVAQTGRPGALGSAELSAVGAHHRVWTRVVEESTPGGKLKRVEHRYVELATGLNYLEDGVWKESKEEIEVLRGHAVARQGQHKVIFAGDIATPGAIDLEMPGGARARMHVLGLAFFDEASGQSVLLAEVKSSTGIVDGNQVIYLDAFTEISADIRYTYTKGGLEQDILLAERLPFAPEDFGLASPTTVLQVLTEFVTLPEVTLRPEPIMQSDGREVSGEELDFGTMRMARGDAFRFDGGTRDERAVRVQKFLRRWEGRDFLIEQVPLRSIAEDLARLPARTGAVPTPASKRIPRLASHHLQVPATPTRMVPESAQPMLMAHYAPPARSFLLDYQILNSTLTNLTLQAQATYYVSAKTELYGTTRFEGGCILKFEGTMSQDLWVHDSLQWAASPYRPVIFTAKNDDSVGEVINGSTGNPVRRDHVALVTATATTLRGARILYARTGIAAMSALVAEDVQWVDCGNAVGSYGQSVTLRNALVATADNVVRGFQSNLTVNVEQLTADHFSTLMSCTNNTILKELNLTNCLFTAGTNWVTGQANPSLHTNGVVWLASSSGIYQTAGGGRYYLAQDSPYHNVGTPNLSANALALVRGRSTYPPLVLANTVLSMDTTLGPQAPRDTDTPDLGYHYTPLDYLFTNSVVTNAQLRIAPGTAIGFGGGLGLILTGTASLVSDGTATQPVEVASCAGVQEDLSLAAITANTYPLHAWRAGTTGGEGTLRFTRFTSAHAQTYPLCQADTLTFSHLQVRDCEFHNGTLQLDLAATNTTQQASVANNLFTQVQIVQSYGEELQGANFIANTVSGGRFEVLSLAPDTWGLHDNLFHETEVSVYLTGTHGWNAYVGCTVAIEPPLSTNDLQLASLAFATGTFGDYYQLTNSPLLNAGSTWATNLGLYHFTTTTNQVKEAGTKVDIGYHYVACDTNSNPVDTDCDGVPDYLEDANGDGSATGDATSWLIYNSGNQLSAPCWLRLLTPLSR